MESISSINVVKAVRGAGRNIAIPDRGRRSAGCCCRRAGAPTASVTRQAASSTNNLIKLLCKAERLVNCYKPSLHVFLTDS